MKKYNHFFIYLSLVLFLLSSHLLAKDIEGTLSRGDGSSFTPQHGSAFSVVLDIKGGFYKGEYDILIRVNNTILYNENNQIDDIYLVFNEPVNDGDIIKIDVKSGQFKFKMSSIDKLPDVIIDAIKTQLPQKSSYNSKQNVKNSIEIEKEYQPHSVDSNPTQTQIVEKPEVKDEKKLGFFDALSKKLGTIFKSEKNGQVISKVEKPNTTEKEVVQEKDFMQPSGMKQGVSGISSQIDTIQKESVVKSGIPNSFQSGNGIDNISVDKVEIPNTQLAGIQDQDINFQPDTSISPKGLTNSLPTEVQNFTKSNMPKVIGVPRAEFKTSIQSNQEVKPKFNSSSNISTNDMKTQFDVPKFENSIESKPDMTQFQDKQIVKDLQAEFDKAELVEVNDIADIAPVRVDIPNEPTIIMEDNQRQRIVITKTLAPVQKEESRVVKRHVTPEVYKRQQEVQRVPDKMSDRVQRGGYIGFAKAKLRVKAYSNNKEVSAWIEVFKAGTKQRVKTFYTGKGRTLRDIKLPAGTYVIKATYRTASVKKQRTLGKVVLSEGGAIDKSISFDNDGKVKIIATKSSRPLYAKVEVFKTGSNRRVTYEFTSRSGGLLTLNIDAGKYDIVVNNHNDVLRFDNVKIIPGKTKVFNADF